jgi:DNA helicase II / ATP-dependent DNA helicase PcrA
LREIIEHMLHESGLITFYQTDKEGKDRLENLEELVNAAEAFVTQEGFGKDAVALPVDEHAGALSEGSPVAVAAVDLAPDAETGEIMSPLAAFLTHASLEAGDNQAQAGQDAIQLMTVHAAKGLEFDAVFITGLEEGLFPHENSASDLDGLEEERRLMYVAITRARKRLYLSFSQTRMLHGQTRYNVKSRFFDELPEAALRWLTPRNQGFGSGFAREYQSAWSKGSGLSGIVGAGKVEPRAVASSGPKTTSSHGLRSGQTVFHNKFGEGVIVTLEGQGEDARAQVNFGRHGMKWLALSVAKLTPVD